jgi:hypothetical protein
MPELSTKFLPGIPSQSFLRNEIFFKNDANKFKNDEKNWREGIKERILPFKYFLRP